MLLIGHELIPSEPFYRISNQEEIAETPSQAVVLFDFDASLAQYCQAQIDSSPCSKNCRGLSV